MNTLKPLRAMFLSLLLLAGNFAHADTIGVDNLAAAGTTHLETVRADTDPHFIMNGTGAGCLTAPSGHEVFEVGFIAGVTTAASLQIGVYRQDTLALIAEGTATSPGVGVNTRIAQAITPVALTGGVVYCIAWRQITSGSLFICASCYTAIGDRSATLTGANALPSTFNPDGAQLDSGFLIFATTQAAAGSTQPARTMHQFRLRR
jgi:hypothetical protein